MRKIFTIAAREYRAMVGTKAFLISIVMMPILMLGSIAAMALLSKVAEVKERKIAIIDQSGELYSVLESEAGKINDRIDQQLADGETEGKFGGSSPEKYLLEQVDASDVNDELLFELSDRVRNQELYAFVVIPEGVFETGARTDATKANEDSSDSPTGTEQGADSIKSSGAKSSVNFYSPDASISSAKEVISRTINEVVKNRRFEEANIDIQKVALASQRVPVKGMGLLSRSADGKVKAATEGNPLKTIFLPMGVMMLMFMVIFMASQPMLESVLEEKSQRIAEVLLGSANPFQLMIGKLFGTVAGSLTIFIIYLTGAYFLAQYQDWTDEIPFHLAPWFIAFQVVGVFFYAAIFMAVGASVSQLKEAQSLLLPVWMLLMSPMFVWLNLVREPMGTLATGFSLFPPATPTTMMLRMTTGHTIPVWQPILGLALTLLATLMIVVIAARIFRVGILWQGKTPKLGEIVRWALKGK